MEVYHCPVSLICVVLRKRIFLQGQISGVSQLPAAIPVAPLSTAYSDRLWESEALYCLIRLHHWRMQPDLAERSEGYKQYVAHAPVWMVGAMVDPDGAYLNLADANHLP